MSGSRASGCSTHTRPVARTSKVLSALLSPTVVAALLLSGTACAARQDPSGVGGLGTSGPATSAPATSAPPSSPRASATARPSGKDPERGPASTRKAELPRGGRTVFPHYRLVGYAGRTGSS